jgi:hypothetical protein
VPPRLYAIRPKKLAPELRKPRPSYRDQARWHRRLALRVWQDPHALRLTTQLAFLALCVWIGVEFHHFVRWGLSGGAEPFAPRPPGVEGFLPISALIGLKHWLLTGTINSIHPAALFILLAVILISIGVKKAFCSFLCPVGTLSEYLWRLGRAAFGRNLRMPRWLDYPLRSFKYLLLLFFLWAVARMDGPTLAAFIGSPYNKVADIKMYRFFAELSSLALKVLVGLGVLSLFGFSVPTARSWASPAGSAPSRSRAPPSPASTASFAPALVRRTSGSTRRRACGATSARPVSNVSRSARCKTPWKCGRAVAGFHHGR